MAGTGWSSSTPRCPPAPRPRSASSRRPTSSSCPALDACSSGSRPADDGAGSQLTPTATYRLQLHHENTLDDARRLLAHLADLGVSHVYLSPILTAVPGSMHGYDVVDHASVAARPRWRRGLGPVQRRGPPARSRCRRRRRAQPRVDRGRPQPALARRARARCVVVVGRVVRHRLGRPRGLPEGHRRAARARRPLRRAAGRRASWRCSRDGVRFAVEAPGHRFPLAPRSLPLLLHPAAVAAGRRPRVRPARRRLAHPSSPTPSTALEPATTDRARRRRAGHLDVVQDLLSRLLEQSAVAAAVDAEIEAVNADPDALHRMLEEQHYRLAFWRTGARRAGLPALLRHHDPRGHPGRARPGLRRRARAAAAVAGRGPRRRPADRPPRRPRRPRWATSHRLRHAAPDAWILVEKILEGDEWLPEDWPVDGTTGYEAMRLLNGLLVDPAGLDGAGRRSSAARTSCAAPTPRSPRTSCSSPSATPSRSCWRPSWSGSSTSPCGSPRPGRCTATTPATTSAEPSPRSRWASTCTAPTWCRAPTARPAPCRHRRRARRPTPPPMPSDRTDLDPRLVDFLADVLTLRAVHPEDGPSDDERELVIRFQQLTGPATAKGLEDTAWYRLGRFIAAAEVGGDPLHPAVSVDQLHEACRHRQERWPRTMTTLSTHDTKRSADVRARLDVLSEPTLDPSWPELAERWLPRLLGALARRRRPRRHHAPRLPPDPPRRVADQQRPARGLPGEGGPRGQAPHGVDQGRRGLRAPASPHWRPLAEDPDLADELAGRRTPCSSATAGGTPRSRPPSACCSQASPTCTRAPRSSTCRWSTPTTADRSTTSGIAGELEDLGATAAPALGPIAKLALTAACLRLRRRRPEAFGAGDGRRARAAGGIRVPTPTASSPSPRRRGRRRRGPVPDPRPRRRRHHGRAPRVVAGRRRLPPRRLRRPADHLAAPSTSWAALPADTPVDRPGGRSRGSMMRFTVWAPDAPTVVLHVDGRDVQARPVTDRLAGRRHAEATPRHPLRLAARRRDPLPDPRSRWQPDGAHGLSAVDAPEQTDFAWTDQHWRGFHLPGAVLYELHVGTFTPAGTFDGVVERLPHLVEPSASTPSSCCRWPPSPAGRGWGYDGVCPHAVHDPYGGPAGLRRLVDAAHAAGIGVVIDVVHNHLGPDGNHLPAYGPYFSERHHTNWGCGREPRRARQRRGPPLLRRAPHRRGRRRTTSTGSASTPSTPWSTTRPGTSSSSWPTRSPPPPPTSAGLAG